MTDDQFWQLVESMRTAQRAYFRNRTPEALELAKTIERAVDAEIKQRREKKEMALFTDWDGK